MSRNQSTVFLLDDEPGMATFKEYPPSQKVGSFSLDKVMETLSNAQTSGK